MAIVKAVKAYIEEKVLLVRTEILRAIELKGVSILQEDTSIPKTGTHFLCMHVNSKERVDCYTELKWLPGDNRGAFLAVVIRPHDIDAVLPNYFPRSKVTFLQIGSLRSCFNRGFISI